MRGEKLLKRSEVRARLNITKYRYSQLIDRGILSAPIRFAKNSHPVHTESQVISAERKLQELSMPAARSRTTKGISNKLFKEIAEAAANKSK